MSDASSVALEDESLHEAKAAIVRDREALVARCRARFGAECPSYIPDLRKMLLAKKCLNEVRELDAIIERYRTLADLVNEIVMAPPGDPRKALLQ